MKKGSRKRKKSVLGISLWTLSVLSITAASVTAASICIMIFSTVYNRALMRDAQINAQQAVRQTTISVNNYLDSMKDRLRRVCDMMQESETAVEFNDDITVMTKLQSDIYAIMIYDSNGEIISCSGDNIVMKENIYRNLSFDQELFEKAEAFIISKPHVQTLFEGQYPWVVTLALREDSPLFGGEIYIAIDFRFSEIAKYIDNVGVGIQGYCYVCDTYGDIVYHPQQQILFYGLKTEPSREMAALEDGVHTGKNVIYTINTTEDGPWRVVGVSHTEELTVERNEQIISSIFISFLCCTVIAVILLFVYSRIVNAPVREIIRAMEEFENSADTFEYNGGGQSIAELRALSDSFVHMAKRIQQLMEQVRAEETALRKTELKALQAQINPHFLYNTLDSIQWMCEQGNNDGAVKMVGALARLFRISISRGHELITIRDELQHARSYLIIQSYRYRNQFSYNFNVESGLEEYLCNKITIQPLIENAIYHGIDRMVDEGIINITVKTAEDSEEDILIIVEDNGVGMTAEQCRKILQKERSDSSGIGVKNVNDRLKIYFGDKYGISIKSELDVGTTVAVRIPKIKKEADHEA